MCISSSLSSKVQEPETSGVVISESRSLRVSKTYYCLRVEEVGCLSSRKNQIFLSSALLISIDPEWTGSLPPTLVRTNFYTQYTDWNANFSQKHPHKTHSEIMFYQVVGHPLARSCWHKIKNHVRLYGNYIYIIHIIFIILYIYIPLYII